jgi:surface-adhesin protein E
MFIRLIVLVLLVLSCSVGLAQAEWKQLVDSPTFGGLNVYVEPTSVRIDKGSGLVKMWILYDYKTGQEGFHVRYLSLKIQRQYDCKQGRSRMLAQSLFGGNMAKGDVIYESTEGTWMPVGPGPIGQSLLGFACSNSKP